MVGRAASVVSPFNSILLDCKVNSPCMQTLTLKDLFAQKAARKFHYQADKRRRKEIIKGF